MLENTTCPICNQSMEKEDSSDQQLYSDFHCRRGSHFFAKRIQDGQLTKIKIKILDESNSYLYMKINFDEGTTQVWKKTSKDTRVNIDHACHLDLSNLDKIKSKIKTYLLFS